MSNLGLGLALFIPFMISNQDKDQKYEFTVKSIDKLIEKGVEILLQQQEKNGEWTYQGVAGKPIGYKVASTSFVCMAILETASTNDKAKGAVEKGIKYIIEACKDDGMTDSGLKSYDTRFWGQTYALAILSDIYKDKKRKDSDEIKDTIENLIKYLEKTASKKEGGWNYANRTNVCSFMTSAMLLNFLKVKDAGFSVKEEILSGAVKGLKGGRLEGGSFLYLGTKGKPNDRNSIPGACARMAVAELALLKYKESDEEKLTKAVDAFFEHWKELKARHKKAGTHAGKYKIAPYYFFFGHYYTAHAIAALSKKEDRDKYYKKLFELLLETREEDGSWNDRVFEPSKSYATAQVISILAPMRNHLDDTKK